MVAGIGSMSSWLGDDGGVTHAAFVSIAIDAADRRETCSMRLSQATFCARADIFLPQLADSVSTASAKRIPIRG
jgi:hypothetical protein